MAKATIFSELWDSYKSVIIHSLVASFGLDFIVRDRVGGDVDTIHNVRNGVSYKNSANEAAYLNRGEYNPAEYHSNEAYSQLIKETRHKGFFEDAYVPGNKIAYGNQSALRADTTHKANLDHVISAKEIHDDPGRVLAGKDGTNLANKQSNLRFTNEKLNKSMGEKDIEIYIQEQKDKGTPLSKETEKALRENYQQARKAYEKELNEYYLSPQFISDATLAAAKVGVAMGIRQVLGYVFLEIWLACEKEIKSLPSGTKLKDSFEAIQRGIRIGIENTKKNYKELLSHFGQGFIAGVLASLATTLINIFFTTGITLAKIIRQAFVTCVQAANVLLFNPKNELLGDQLKRASSVVVVGASTIVGIIAAAAIGKLALPVAPFLLGIIKTFVALLVSGLVSCTILVLIDRSKLITSTLEKLNHYGSYSAHLQNISDSFTRMACEIEGYDFGELASQLKGYENLAESLDNKSDDEVADLLLKHFEDNNVSLPWEGDFDEFMGNKNNKLTFD